MAPVIVIVVDRQKRQRGFRSLFSQYEAYFNVSIALECSCFCFGGVCTVRDSVQFDQYIRPSWLLLSLQFEDGA
jgi:hypothetical protein